MHHFRIAAIDDPQSLPRIAGFFAQRAIIPSAMRMEALRPHIRIDVAVAGLTASQANVIAAKLGEIFAVIEAVTAPAASGPGRDCPDAG